jgi:hypothetical protein
VILYLQLALKKLGKQPGELYSTQFSSREDIAADSAELKDFQSKTVRKMVNAE